MRINRFRAEVVVLALLCVLTLSGGAARGSIAYGSINNFDTVNDTGVQCHGFEVELDGVGSADITYTYDYNHYGTPKIVDQVYQDLSMAWHTNVLVRYEAVWTNTGWSAYTAIPSGPIAPTQGHQFTNPGTNFGGEHFGVGYRTQPSKVNYYWLVEGAGHTLAVGPQVNVSTQTFAYSPPIPAVAPAQVVAVIPAPVLPQIVEFSDATWVKEIRTTSHTNNEVRLQDLMTPDTNNPTGRDWRNGQPDEVEVEWQLLQIDFLSADYNPTNGIGGPNGKLQAAAQGVNKSDDVVTRRYEYYAYVGPYADPDTHQALDETVAADGLHGTGTYSNTVVVGKFLGAQMSAMVASPPIGLIDHLPDGEVGSVYPTRSLVIAGNTNFTASILGTPPLGMAFDPASGRIYGTPYEAGEFLLSVRVASTNNVVLTKTYPFMVAAAGVVLPAHSSVDTSVFPTGGGTTGGDGVYTNSTTAAVTATANAGYGFVNWTDNGAVVSTSATYHFTNIVNRSLVANFGPQLSLPAFQSHSLAIAWLTNFSGYGLQQNSDLRTTNWVSVTNAISTVGATYQISIPTTNSARFFRLTHP